MKYGSMNLACAETHRTLRDAIRGSHWRAFLVIASLLTLLAGTQPAGAQQARDATTTTAGAQSPAPGASHTTPAAKVGDEVITLDEVEQGVRPELARIEAERFNLLDDKLQELIANRVLAQEAKKRGTTLEQLLKDEVYSKTPAVTDKDVTEFMSENRDRLPKGDESDLRRRVRDYLRSRRRGERQQALVDRLREEHKVAVYLRMPDAARVSVDAGKGFVRGAKDAPIAIVEFSDFQCPFCKTATTTLKRLLARYPGKVKLVFRDYPIAKLHPTAPKAHQAARCAAEQGKFWEYHDVLFERSPRQSPVDLRQYAKDLKLNESAFAQCLDSGKYEADINRDIQEGSALGVTGTPAFFINGWPLTGAMPLAHFQRIIESELTRLASR